MSVQLKSYKRDFEHSYSYGVFPTLELLKFRAEHVISVLVSSKGKANSGVLKIEEICARRGIRVEANDKLVDRLAPKENAYAIGVFRKYDSQLSRSENHVALVNPGDMGNLGTIVRTMLGFGVTNLALIRPAVDIFDPKVIRSSMGAIFQLSFQYFDSFSSYQRSFERAMYPFMTSGKMPLSKLKPEQPFTLVFGNESAGLPEDFLTVGTSVTIPHSESIDSLNLPIAVGVALYEVTKRSFEKL